jgi:hypothetical protein
VLHVPHGWRVVGRVRADAVILGGLPVDESRHSGRCGAEWVCRQGTRNRRRACAVRARLANCPRARRRRSSSAGGRSLGPGRAGDATRYEGTQEPARWALSESGQIAQREGRGRRARHANSDRRAGLREAPQRSRFTPIGTARTAGFRSARAYASGALCTTVGRTLSDAADLDLALPSVGNPTLSSRPPDRPNRSSSAEELDILAATPWTTL